VVANLFGPDLGYVVIIILVVLVGGSQLPKIARNVGMAGKEFRSAQRESEQEAEQAHSGQASSASRSVPSGVPAAPAAVRVSAPAVPPTPAGDGAVTLSRADLDELLKAREEQVRRQMGGLDG
jgi:sec-independent protein translocase protein TatA